MTAFPRLTALALGAILGVTGMLAVDALLASGNKRLDNCDDVAIGLNATELRDTLRTVHAFDHKFQGYENVAVGIGALDTLTSGTGNTAIGAHAGDGITIGNGNTIVGRQLGLLPPDLSNTTIVFNGNGTIIYCRRERAK